MTLSEWIISVSGATIAIVLAVATYFAEKWIGSVDTTLKELTSDFKGLSKQVSSLEQNQSDQTENITQTIQSQLSGVKLYGKVDRIEEKVNLIQDVVQGKLLPHAEKHREDMGRVILLETNMQKQSDKIMTMFKVVEAVHQKQVQLQAEAQVPKPAKGKV
jgi:uncharacterized protein YoxC